jgi:predicted NUDIX family phosphoesterase
MSKGLNKNEIIKSLEDLSEDVKKIKSSLGQRRPILIEFCGSPKSGKSTSITSLNIFLKRNGFKTAIVPEMAAICPVENKTHPYFNSWTLFSSLAETIRLLSVYRNKVDIIIVDRAIFDAICWFEWLNTNSSKSTPYLDDKTYEGFLELLLKRYIWSSLFDLTIILKVKPQVSLDREYANLLTEKRGSIMNEVVLEGFNEAVISCYDKYREYFQNIEIIDTSEKDPNEVGLDVTKRILLQLKDILIERIGYIDESVREKLKEGINEFSIIKGEDLKFDIRKTVEESNHLQPVPIAVITNKKRTKLLVVRKNYRSTGKGSPENNRYLTYLGGHIREEDKGHNHNNSVIEVLQNTIHRELQEEIGESYYPKTLDPFLIYVPNSAKSKRHLAICFIIEEDLDNKKFKLTSDEFIMKTGPNNKSGHVIDLDELLTIETRFEEWSINILNHVFNREFHPIQPSLFEDFDF